MNGEDPIKGNPWWHEEITKAALGFYPEWHPNAGFARDAAASVAWSADFVDSYLYNPLWWAVGGPLRLQVAMATAQSLTKFHFDDLVSTHEVIAVWRRYFLGTLAGLLWACERNDVSAAHNILGTSLHAVQDFYSHSNWVDAPERRTRTWFEVRPEERRQMDIWTGAYERPPAAGRKPHGKFAPAATIFRQPGVAELMEIAASPWSPLAETELCKEWKRCQAGRPTELQTVFGVQVPPSVVYVAPPGIALDSNWTAEIGVQVRGISDRTGREMFAIVVDLAKRASVQWVRLLETAMGSGAAPFWSSIRSKVGTKPYRGLDAASAGKPEAKAGMPEYEEYFNFPFMFIGAGPYPPRNDNDEYYLRTRVLTGSDLGAGTDADIVLAARGHAGEFVLDYLPLTEPNTNPILQYNDFEKGSHTVYTCGPFVRIPSAITLTNRAANTEQVVDSLFGAIKETVAEAVDSVAGAIVTIFHGNAEEVGHTQLVWERRTLNHMRVSEKLRFEARAGDNSKGIYAIQGELICTNRGVDGAGAGWAEYRVQLSRLVCWREQPTPVPIPFGGTSDISGMPGISDEPFVLAVLIPSMGDIDEKLKKLSGMMEGVDTGESRNLCMTLGPVKEHANYAQLVLTLMIMEGDWATTGSAREEALDQFAGEIARSSDAQRRQLAQQIGTMVATDWNLGEIEVYGFGRTIHQGQKVGVTYGTVLSTRQVNRWLKGGETIEFALDTNAMHFTPFHIDETYVENGLAAGQDSDVGGSDGATAELPRWYYHIAASPAEANVLLSQTGSRMVRTSATPGRIAIHIATHSNQQCSTGWGVKRTDSLEDMLNFLNGGGIYGVPVEDASIIAVQNGAWCDLYAFYREGAPGQTKADWAFKRTQSVQDVIAYLSGANGYQRSLQTARIVRVKQMYGSEDYIIWYRERDQCTRSLGWGWKEATSRGDLVNFVTGQGYAPIADGEVVPLRADDNDYLVFCRS
jgi:hypothetical protein